MNIKRGHKTTNNTTVVYTDNLDGYDDKYNLNHMRVVMHLFDGDNYVVSLIGKQVKKVYYKKLKREVFDGNVYIIMSSDKEFLTRDDFNQYKKIIIDRESSQTVLRLAYKKEFNLSMHRVDIFSKRRALKLKVISDYPGYSLHQPVDTL